MCLEGTPPDAPISIVRVGLTEREFSVFSRGRPAAQQLSETDHQMSHEEGRRIGNPEENECDPGSFRTSEKDPGVGARQQGWRTQRKGSIGKLVRNPEAFAGCADADATEPGRYRQSVDWSVKCGVPG